ncbi:FAD-dependent thymidylate synthase [Candidatus Giovannonibacteria bacterium]|nr:FAD-dependent thymidylate synthase [Candidatus Giovannonibacteria bacterium]
MAFPPGAIEFARDFVNKPIYAYTDLEKRMLKSFFTNFERRVFFMHSLPSNVSATLFAMYSRMKNQRGIRGVFVDSFIPEFLACSLQEFIDKESEFGQESTKFLRSRDIKNLNDFYAYSDESRRSVEEFLGSIQIDPDYLQRLAESNRTKRFLGMWLDKYGHNSIARTSSFYLGFEQISLLAAKSIEWTRPGAGYIELSTRYVDMGGKDCFPIAELLGIYGKSAVSVIGLLEKSFDYYRELQGDKFSGPFPQFLRENYSKFITNEKDLENGVVGETCDVLGNFLPCATLTSVGVHISGESLPELMKHLIVDNTPENEALAEAVMAESEKVGANQFIRHFEPTPWKTMSWEYLDTKAFLNHEDPIVVESGSLSREAAEKILVRAFQKLKSGEKIKNIDDLISKFKDVPRGEYDRLSNQFERINATLSGVMSFRGWRDLHRQGFSTHLRTFVTPDIGFYKYDKKAPESFFKASEYIHNENKKVYRELDTLPREILQYPMAIGNLIGFEISSNLLQWEFCNWQRTKFSVNHEVRQVFLSMENLLRKNYPWWKDISRADITPAYIFARTEKGIPL